MPPLNQGILIVGGGLGIGFSTTKSVLETTPVTTKVVVFGLHADPDLSALSTAFAGRIFTVLGDVTSDEDRKKAIAVSDKEMGGVDTLVYCAGVMPPVKRIETVDLEDVKKAYDINLFGVVAMSQLCLPQLRRSAQLHPTNAACGKMIVLSSSCDARVTYMGWMAYCTSKAAVSRFVQLLAHEEPTIAVQGVYPRLTRTKMPEDTIAGRYEGIMADHEVERFRLWDEVGDATIEPPMRCAEAVAKLATGKFIGGRSGELLYYDEHVPDHRPKL